MTSQRLAAVRHCQMNVQLIRGRFLASALVCFIIYFRNRLDSLLKECTLDQSTTLGNSVVTLKSVNFINNSRRYIADHFHWTASEFNFPPKCNLNVDVLRDLIWLISLLAIRQTVKREKEKNYWIKRNTWPNRSGPWTLIAETSGRRDKTWPRPIPLVSFPRNSTSCQRHLLITCWIATKSNF
jgi:hypothetical protein